MSLKVDGTTIKIYQGDSGSITFNGLEENMHIYMAIRDKENQLVFPEMDNTVNNEGEITFSITAEMSDMFDVDLSLPYTTYYYGIKQVDDVTVEENTIFLGEKPKFEDKYLVKVYPKKVEGLYDNGEG